MNSAPENESRQSLIDALADALYNEHCHECNDNTCDIKAAYDRDLFLWAAHLYLGTTENTDRTQAAYNALAPTQAELDVECKELLSFPSRRCNVCNSIIRDDGEPNEAWYCDNCCATVPCPTDWVIIPYTWTHDEGAGEEGHECIALVEVPKCEHDRNGDEVCGECSTEHALEVFQEHVGDCTRDVWGFAEEWGDTPCDMSDPWSYYVSQPCQCDECRAAGESYDGDGPSPKCWDEHPGESVNVYIHADRARPFATLDEAKKDAGREVADDHVYPWSQQ